MVLLHSFQDIIDTSSQIKSISLPTLKQNPFKIEFSKDDVAETKYSSMAPVLPFANSDLFHANIIQGKRLTAIDEGCKAVYEITFDVEGSKFNFKAGDTIGVLPQNNVTDVDFIKSHLNLKSIADLNYTLSLDESVKGSKIPLHVPVKSTLNHVLTHCLDLRSILKKAFLLALSKYTKDDKEKKILEYLCSKEGATAYSTHIINKNIGILDIFTIFKSCKPPIEVLLAHLPRLLPRPYSILNSGLKTNRILKICFSVITNEQRTGLTTGWLESLILNKESLENRLKHLDISKECCKQQVPIYLRKNISKFSMPENLETKLILIGPGTGVAPFIGFLEEREYLKSSNGDIKLGDAWLFFGCRNPELDYIYEEELKGFRSRASLNKLCTAFSRVDDHSIKYVQDAIIQNGKEVTQLIKNGACVYICGDLKTMGADIREVFIKCLVEHDNMTLEEAQNEMTKMQNDKRYFVDAWS